MVSGEVDWQKKSYALSAGSRTLKWVYSKDASTEEGEDCGWVDALTVGTDSYVGVPGNYAEALDCDLKFTTSGSDNGTWSVASGIDSEYYYDADAMRSYDTLGDGNDSCLQTIVDSGSAETITFYWKTSCEAGSDYLEFCIDDVPQGSSISGEEEWDDVSFPVSAGTRTLTWRYVSNGGDSGANCGWVDFVQWTGHTPAPDPDNWQGITFKHDVTGRRVEKKVDGYSTRYVHDGDHIIAEYDGNNNLLRKFIYGPGVDQAVSMIEEGDDDSPYYYHFDALGSVVALSDKYGDTIQTYEYSVYGDVATDGDNPNPYMFAGRRYDVEIGLYYNRARYYNPYTGRFLQTDPIGYGNGMNLYRYCMNNPLNVLDPFGLSSMPYPYSVNIRLRFQPQGRGVDDFYESFTNEEGYCDQRKAERQKQIDAVCGTDIDSRYDTCIHNADRQFYLCMGQVARTATTIAITLGILTPINAFGNAAIVSAYSLVATTQCQDAHASGKDFCQEMRDWCKSSGKGDKPIDMDGERDLWPGDQYVMPESPFINPNVSSGHLLQSER